MPTEEHAQRGLRGGRMEAFSDGVFAIAITLLVLDLEVPGDTGEGLLRGLLEQWPSYLAHVVSFATVGAVWLGHLAVTGFLHHADVWLLRLNLLLLLLVAVLPFPTRLLAGGIASEGGREGGDRDLRHRPARGGRCPVDAVAVCRAPGSRAP